MCVCVKTVLRNGFALALEDLFAGVGLLKEVKACVGHQRVEAELVGGG